MGVPRSEWGGGGGGSEEVSLSLEAKGPTQDGAQGSGVSVRSSAWVRGREKGAP